jgi:cysteine synthase A
MKPELERAADIASGAVNALGVLAAIGDTPLVELTRVVPTGHARVLAKLEGHNPTGSLKDRMALSVVVAERLGPERCVVTLLPDTGL